MDLFEYQARDIFEKHGVPVLGGVVATTPEEARAGAEQLLGGQPGVVVVKAQVKVGGRGKAGGVKLARSADEAAEKAAEILGMDIKGHTVHRVMIAAGAKIADRVLLLPPAGPRRAPLPGHVLGRGRHGHRAARGRASRGARQGRRRPAHRHRPGQGRRDRRRRRLRAGASPRKVAAVLQTLWTVYRSEDATLVEVNPLVLTEDGEIVALDGKVTLDENADFRHPEHAELEDAAAADPLEARGQGGGPQLRQARRRGRHHRQRRRARHEHARRRRVRR